MLTAEQMARALEIATPKPADSQPAKEEEQRGSDSSLTSEEQEKGDSSEASDDSAGNASSDNSDANNGSQGSDDDSGSESDGAGTGDAGNAATQGRKAKDDDDARVPRSRLQHYAKTLRNERAERQAEKEATNRRLQEMEIELAKLRQEREMIAKMQRAQSGYNPGQNSKTQPQSQGQTRTTAGKTNQNAAGSSWIDNFWQTMYGTPEDAQAQDQQEQTVTDPTVRALQEEIRALKEQVQTTHKTTEDFRREQELRRITAEFEGALVKYPMFADTEGRALLSNAFAARARQDEKATVESVAQEILAISEGVLKKAGWSKQQQAANAPAATTTNTTSNKNQSGKQPDKNAPPRPPQGVGATSKAQGTPKGKYENLPPMKKARAMLFEKYGTPKQ
jgi:hypothetical protein